VNGAVVVTSNYIKEHKLLWPKVILPTVAGLWKQKGRREPHDVGKGYMQGYILEMVGGPSTQVMRSTSCC
jgi:hypothetical protein